MSFEVFDTLAFSKRLQSAGVPASQADAQASAQVELIVSPLLANMATKRQFERYVTKESFGASIRRQATKDDLERFATKEDLESFATKEDLERFATKQDLELLGKNLTIRLGGMIVIGVVALAALTQIAQ